MSAVALLAGLLAAPAALLWLGHGLRHRGPIGRGAFWGGVIGYLLAMGAFLVVLMVPPVAWTPSPWRTAAVYWILPVTPAVGAAVGALVRRRRNRTK